MTNTPEYVSPHEAAEYYGVSSRTILRMVASGRLPAVRLGPRIIRIRRNDLESIGASA